jgi:hypothetical protein
LLLQPTRVGLHRDLEIALSAVAVDAEGRVEVGVAERLRGGVNASDAAQLSREDIVRENGRCILYYVFRSDKHALEPATNPPNRGAADLTIAMKLSPHLEGDYWMEVGTRGRVRTTGHSRTTYDTFEGARLSRYK